MGSGREPSKGGRGAILGYSAKGSGSYEFLYPVGEHCASRTENCCFWLRGWLGEERGEKGGKWMCGKTMNWSQILQRNLGHATYFLLILAYNKEHICATFRGNKDSQVTRFKVNLGNF